MPQAHQAPVPSHLILRILLPNLLNLGPGLLVPPSPYPKAPEFMSLLISTRISHVPGSWRGRNPCLGSLCPVPVASPPTPVLSTHPCV